MDVSEAELRAMVRDAIARQGRIERQPAPLEAPWRAHASHGLLPLARGGDGDGACLIEPSVRCNHCGYCLSFGH
jgi:hypothetical protein